ncbi:NADP-dependent oxidoreductase domain-containing protein 1 [Parambassis ranga]|uniref:NADP-dependent oxidoreductase domain-containing protein 1 n=1 Tax=Parambassis ranga TaxID=210632 RepID=A0A6P7HIS3_9TELE|nr:NADP-dependent oxidoreductase domain-containing protein 1 [Parambassis ranga]
MADVTAGLSSLSVKSGLTEDESKTLPYLRARSAALTFCGCAHAAFMCELVNSLRCVIRGQTADLCVGILGMGHLGKQLFLTLREKTSINPSQIKISTRRPELAVEFVEPGVECFYDSGRLAAWADVLFLCCLPSQLHKVCADLRSHLSKHCLVYSFTTAVPVSRLAGLLGHNFIVKPRYDFVSCKTQDVWLSTTHVTTALMDPSLIEASCPLSMKGGISLSLHWVCAVFYSLLNVCTSAGLGSSETLSLINSMFQKKWANTVQLNAQSFISSSYASSLQSHEPFPWISLTDVQTKETPLLLFLSSSKSMQQCISAAYKSQLETSSPEEFGIYFKCRLFDGHKFLMNPSTHMPKQATKAQLCDVTAFLDLLNRMLTIDPSARIHPAQVLEHPFIAEFSPKVKQMMVTTEAEQSWARNNAEFSSKTERSSSRTEDKYYRPISRTIKDIKNESTTRTQHKHKLSSRNVSESSPRSKKMRVTTEAEEGMLTAMPKTWKAATSSAVWQTPGGRSDWAKDMAVFDIVY